MKLTLPVRGTPRTRRQKSLHLLVATSLVALSAGLGGFAGSPAVAAPNPGKIHIDGIDLDDTGNNEPKPACAAFEVEFFNFGTTPATHTARIRFTVQGGGADGKDQVVTSTPDHSTSPYLQFAGNDENTLEKSQSYTLTNLASFLAKKDEVHVRVEVSMDDDINADKVTKSKVIKTGPCLSPAISVVKTNDADGDGTFTDPETAPAPSSDVTFQVAITNVSAVPVVIGSLTDQVGDALLSPSPVCLTVPGGQDVVGRTLAAAGAADSSDEITCRFTLTGYSPPWETTKTNEVTVTTTGAAKTVTGSDTSVVASTPAHHIGLDLGITKTGPANVTTGGTGTYTLTVTNHGTAAATSRITVVDTLPPGVTVGTATGDFGCTVAGSTVTCITDSHLAANQTMTISLPATFTTSGTKQNVATVTVDRDSNTENNQATFTTTVTDPYIPPPPPLQLPSDLSVKKTGPASVTPGASVTWTLTVTNKGPGTASGFTVVDTLPAGVTRTSVTGSGFTCAATGVSCTYNGVLPAGASAALTLVGSLAADVTGTSISNVVVVTPTDATPADNTDTLVSVIDRPAGPADLVLEKIGPDLMRDPGDPVTWTITIVNAGASSAGAFTVTDVIEEGMTLVSTSGTGFVCTPGTTLSCAYAGPLAPGSTAVLLVTVALAEDYAFPVANNTATAVLSGDPTPQNNTDTATVAVDAFTGGGGEVLPSDETASPSPLPTLPFTDDEDDDLPILPFTGSPIDLILGAGIVLALAGLSVVAGARQRTIR